MANHVKGIVFLFLVLKMATASKIELTTSPSEITPPLTRDLTLSCGLKDTSAVKKDIKKVPYNVLSVLSIVVTRGDSEYVAMVTHLTPATAFVDKDSLTVKGDVSGTSGQGAYLELTWTEPKVNQSGNYRCEVNAMGQFGQTVELSDLVTVKLGELTLDGMGNYLQQVEKQKQTLKSENDQLKRKNDQLKREKNKFKRENDQLKSEKDQLNREKDQMKSEKDQLKREKKQCTLELAQTKTDLENLKRTTVCPKGWKKFRDHCYKTLHGYLSYSGAKSACQQEGAKMAMPGTTVDSAFVYDNMAGRRQTWIGLNDIMNEGKFVWESGRPLQKSQMQWQRNEPNNLRNEDCVMLGNFEAAHWNDEGCGKPLVTVCQRDLPRA